MQPENTVPSAPKLEHTAKPMPKSGFDGKRTAPNRFNKK